MSGKSKLERAALFGSVGGVVGFWLVRALVYVSCNLSTMFGDEISAEGTTWLAAFAIAIAMFLLGYTTSASADKVEKLGILLAIAYLILWVGYILLDDGNCSARLWRQYLAFLIVPYAILSLLLFGRQWTKADE